VLFHSSWRWCQCWLLQQPEPATADLQQMQLPLMLLHHLYTAPQVLQEHQVAPNIAVDERLLQVVAVAAVAAQRRLQQQQSAVQLQQLLRLLQAGR
jgi:hypothetical protein